MSIAAPTITIGIGGTVTEGKKPVKDATVYLSRNFSGTPYVDSTKTDKNGYYRFTNLNSFTMAVTATAKGLAPSAVLIANGSASTDGAAARPTGSDIALKKKKGPKELAKASINDLGSITTSTQGAIVISLQPSTRVRTFEMVDARGAVRYRSTVNPGVSRIELPVGLPEGLVPQVR